MAKLSSYTKTLRSGDSATYWRLRFYADDGNPKTKDFSTKRDALAHLKKLEQGLDDEPVVAKIETMLVKEAAEQFLQESKVGRDGRVALERTSLEDYGQKFARAHSMAWWTRPLDAITKDDARRFRDYLQNERGLARSTTRNTLTAFRTVLKWTIDEEHFPGPNPFQSVTVAVDKRGNENGPVLKSEIHTRAEVTKILDRLDELCASSNRNTSRAWTKYRAMIVTAFLCGPRISEIRGLPRELVDLENGVLTIEWRVDRHGDFGNLKSSHGYREIPMPQRVIGAIQAWFVVMDAEEKDRTEAERKRRRMSAPDLPFDGGLAFPELGGGVMDSQNFGRNGWRKLFTGTGLKYRKFHATRHFFASGLISGGVNLKDLCHMIGHHDESFTLKRYGKLMFDENDRDRRRSAVEKAAAALDL